MAKIDIDDDLHGPLKAYCKENRLYMKDFTSQLLRIAIMNPPEKLAIFRGNHVVEKKPPAPPLKPIRATADHSEIYTRPPFWANRKFETEE